MLHSTTVTTCTDSQLILHSTSVAKTPKPSHPSPKKRRTSKPIPGAPVAHPAARLPEPGTIRGWGFGGAGVWLLRHKAEHTTDPAQHHPLEKKGTPTPTPPTPHIPASPAAKAPDGDNVEEAACYGQGRSRKQGAKSPSPGQPARERRPPTNQNTQSRTRRSHQPRPRPRPAKVMSPKTSHPADATDHNKLQDASHAQGWSPIRWRASWIASFVGGRVQRIQPTRPPGLDIIYCNQNNSPQGIGTNLSEPAASTIRGDFVGRCRRWCRICRHHGSRQIKKVEKPRLALQSRDVGSQSGSDVLPSQVATPSESRQYKTAPRKKPIRMRPLHTPLARQPEASAHPREPLQLEGIEPSPASGCPPLPGITKWLSRLNPSFWHEMLLDLAQHKPVSESKFA